MMTYTMGRQGFVAEDFIRTALDCRLDGIDWVTTHGRNPEELKKMSDDAGLKVVCHTFMMRKVITGEPDWLDQAKIGIENAVTLGAPIVMVPTMENAALSREAFRKHWIKVLTQVAELTDDAGLILTVENFPGINSAFVTAADFFEAQREIPQLRLTYDNGNAGSGENPADSFNKCRDYVVHAHFKDWYIRNEPQENYSKMLDGKYYSPALIGEGDIDTVACWRAMRDAGYQGYINIEYESDTVKADQAIARAANFLRNIN